jgi:hypothetical protein
MNHTAGVVQGHKTRGIVAFLPIAFGLGVSIWVPSLARSPIEYGSVGEEKELGNEVLPDLDARSSDA